MLERSYAFNIGRFLRPDPMQDEYPGLSPYAYANNNPLKYVDPDGSDCGTWTSRRNRLNSGTMPTTFTKRSRYPKSTNVDVGVAAAGVAVGMVLPGLGKRVYHGSQADHKKDRRRC